MVLHVKGQGFSYHLFDEIALLTGNSYLIPNTLRHDEANSVVMFTIRRLPLISLRRKLFGTLDVPSYDRSRPLVTRIEIRDVGSCRVKTLGEEITQREFPILIGVWVKDGKLTVTSAEEDRGVAAYSLEVALRSIDIALIDVEA